MAGPAIQGDPTLPWASHPWVAAQLPELVAVEPVLHDRLRGDTLSHCDLRADNVLLTADAVWIVDWAHAGNAARWLDPVLVLGDVIASGAGTGDGGEIDIERLLLTHKAFAGVDEWTVSAMLVHARRDAALAQPSASASGVADDPRVPTRPGRGPAPACRPSVAGPPRCADRQAWARGVAAEIADASAPSR